MIGYLILIDHRGYTWAYHRGEGRVGKNVGLLFSTGLPIEVLRGRKPQSIMGQLILIDNEGST